MWTFLAGFVTACIVVPVVLFIGFLCLAFGGRGSIPFAR